MPPKATDPTKAAVKPRKEWTAMVAPRWPGAALVTAPTVSDALSAVTVMP